MTHPRHPNGCGHVPEPSPRPCPWDWAYENVILPSWGATPEYRDGYNTGYTVGFAHARWVTWVSGFCWGGIAFGLFVLAVYWFRGR